MSFCSKIYKTPKKNKKNQKKVKKNSLFNKLFKSLQINYEKNRERPDFLLIN